MSALTLTVGTKKAKPVVHQASLQRFLEGPGEPSELAHPDGPFELTAVREDS